MQRIFIGDVQGCADELEEIIGRAHGRYGRDFELWLVGDLVNRGPANLRVLRRVRELAEVGRARSILGNHELHLLATAVGLRVAGPGDTFQEVLDAPDAAEWIEWLRRRPLLESGVLGDSPFVMVHAAAHPAWSLVEHERMARRVEARLTHGDLDALRKFLDADPARDAERNALGRLVSCRSVAGDGSWSKHEPTPPALPWHRAWSAAEPAYAVVYGHWSLQRLHVAPRLRGLDTGCVHGGQLTAWVPASRGDAFAVPDGRFWQVPARARYFRDDLEASA